MSDTITNASEEEMPGSLNNASSFHCRTCGSTGEKYFSCDGNCLVCEEEGERLLDDGWHHDSDMEAR